MPTYPDNVRQINDEKIFHWNSIFSHRNKLSIFTYKTLENRSLLIQFADTTFAFLEIRILRWGAHNEHLLDKQTKRFDEGRKSFIEVELEGTAENNLWWEEIFTKNSSQCRSLEVPCSHKSSLKKVLKLIFISINFLSFPLLLPLASYPS